MQQWKFFRIPVNGADVSADDFNLFLRSHRVLAVHREFVVQGESSYWALAVEYLADGAITAPRRDGGKKEKIDYREVLSPDEFARFALLREWRKHAAQVDAVPVYTILTNEQMAEIAKGNCRTKADLTRVDGIGAGRMEKYGAAILQAIASVTNEADGQPVS
ncbi:MAG: HRDC domain-containing protein [Desulfuromonadales bacterium]